jgi:PIN domain nuclease of toxin-antitoxin system
MLLDTHAAIWLARGVDLSDESRHSITQARDGKGVYLSAVSVWEVGNLIRRQRAYLDMTLAGWVQGFLAAGGFHTIDLTVAIVIGAADLPGRFHDDPADRFLVATARHLDVPILTRDRRILAYAEAGHVAAIAC